MYILIFLIYIISSIQNYRRLEACLSWINLNNDETAPKYHLIPRRGYTNKGWQQIDPSSEFILKTYDLTVQNYEQTCCYQIMIHPIQIIEQVNFNHINGRLFTEAVLNRFDLKESQNAIFKNSIMRRSNAPGCLDILHQGVIIFFKIKNKIKITLFYFSAFNCKTSPS